MKRTKFFFGAAMCLLLAVSAVFAEAEKDSPEYALKQAAMAVRQKDEILLTKFVNENAFFAVAYDDGATALAENIADLKRRYPDDPFFWHDTDFMKDYAAQHKTYAMSLIKGIRHAYFNDMPPASLEENPALFLAEELRTFISESDGEIIDLKRQGDAARARVKITGSQSDYGRLTDGLVFEFSLRREKTGWQIEKIENADELLLPVTDSAEKFWTLKGWQ